MSIKLLARELYHLQKEKERLGKEVEAATLPEQSTLKESLRKVTAEWQIVRDMMDGKKSA